MSKSARANKNNEFKFLPTDNIGAPGAEEDHFFLTSCFVERPELDVLLDPTRAERVIIGRTGSGKTALLHQIKQTQGNVIELDPNDLSIQFLSNSTIIQFLDELGVNLDLFFRLLWRHVFIIELIKRRYGINSESKRDSFLTTLRGIISRDKARETSVAYLREWSDNFWLETEYRIQEITETLGRKISASLGVNYADIIKCGAEGASSLTVEQKAECLNKAQRTVSDLQMRKMSAVMELLEDDLLSESSSIFYIIIDKLDEQWVEDRLRYRMIRALIETQRDFQRVRHSKIIIALRQDLLERVIRETRDDGFQEEKYEALYLRLRWDSESLMKLVDRRINHLIRRRYQPKSMVRWTDVFPHSIKSAPFDQWLVSRTLYRPRDIIAFVNEIIHQGGPSGITTRVCDAAESNYSTKRLGALSQEWYTDTKFLKKLAESLKGMPATFALSEIPQKSVEDVLLEIASLSEDRDDVAVDFAYQATVADMPIMKARIRLVALLFHWGVVGVKVEAHKRSLFAYRDGASLSQNLITDATRVTVAPAFHRDLGIGP